MWGFAWEPVVTAGVTGLFAVLGIVLSVRSQSDKTRKAGREQHEDQDRKLDQLIRGHARLESKIDANKNIAEQGLSELSGKVQGVISTTDTLFTMIVDLDKKATSRGNKVSGRLKTIEPLEEANRE
jgi:hypothetical protein